MASERDTPPSPTWKPGGRGRALRCRRPPPRPRPGARPAARLLRYRACSARSSRCRWPWPPRTFRGTGGFVSGPAAWANLTPWPCSWTPHRKSGAAPGLRDLRRRGDDARGASWRAFLHTVEIAENLPSSPGQRTVASGGGPNARWCVNRVADLLDDTGVLDESERLDETVDLTPARGCKRTFSHGTARRTRSQPAAAVPPCRRTRPPPSGTRGWTGSSSHRTSTRPPRSCSAWTGWAIRGPRAAPTRNLGCPPTRKPGCPPAPGGRRPSLSWRGSACSGTAGPERAAPSCSAPKPTSSSRPPWLDGAGATVVGADPRRRPPPGRACT